jgi:hypothetical protein
VGIDLLPFFMVTIFYIGKFVWKLT